MAKAKRIIAYFIKDHLIPHASSFNTPKKVYDALTKMFEGKNINCKTNLRNQLKNVKIQNSDTIQSYFTSVSQIKEQLEVVDDNVEEGEIEADEENVEEGEIVMTTLNGILIS